MVSHDSNNRVAIGLGEVLEAQPGGLTGRQLCMAFQEDEQTVYFQISEEVALRLARDILAKLTAKQASM